MTRFLLDALVPIFVGLRLGYIAGRRGMIASYGGGAITLAAWMLVMAKYF
jgi:hypothetical protein